MHIGIDLGGTKTEIKVLDSDSNSLFSKRVSSPQGDYQNTLQCLSALVTEAESVVKHQCSVGIGIPGSVDSTQLIKNANSTWLIGHDLKSDMETRLERPVILANDADCFALSEATDGAGREAATIFGVILGTGVGGGFCKDKRLLQGPNSIAGEWGHNPLPTFTPDQARSIWQDQAPIKCYCGQFNCIETFLSGPAMLKRFHQRFPDQSGMFTSSHDIINAYRADNPSASTYFNDYLDQLGRALAQVINIVDPDVIVLGGGLSQISELYQALPSRILPYLFASGSGHPQLNTAVVPPIHGDASGVRGAAWLGAQFMRTV